jgi:hypothetical protein
MAIGAVADAGRCVREPVLGKLAELDRALAMRESGATLRAVAVAMNAETPGSKHGGAGSVRVVL